MMMMLMKNMDDSDEERDGTGDSTGNGYNLQTHDVTTHLRFLENTFHHK